MADLTRLWSGLSKPPGLEQSKIEDYFDFAFVALPHKILQPEKFVEEVQKLGTRFREGYQDPQRKTFLLDDATLPIFLPEYHRRIPADGFSVYAENVWAQIDSNKDLDLPTQQELLAQFRCDEIAKEVLVAFDAIIVPFEERQSTAAKSGSSSIITELGSVMTLARADTLKAFEVEASRYHKGVFNRKQTELAIGLDTRLKALFAGQLAAAHKAGVLAFTEAVSAAVKAGQRKGASYDFSAIVTTQKAKALQAFADLARSSSVADAPWSNYVSELELYKKDLDIVSAQLRKDELKRLMITSRLRFPQISLTNILFPPSWKKNKT